MKSPRFLAALAMAAVLTTGTTAHAAFNQTGGATGSGQTPMQQADVFKDPSTSTPFDVEGDIRVDGTFTKIINNFPTPTQDGHYLRVTMPIKMDFTYDVDTNTMTSAEGVVVNNSVKATGLSTGQPTPTLEPKKIKMTVVDFAESTVGTTTMNSGVEFVNSVTSTPSGQTAKVQLPFQLNITGSTGNVTNYSIKNIQENKKNNTNAIAAIEIDPNSALKLKIDKINGQNIGNADLITNQTSLTSHSLKLKFEYDVN